MEKSPEAFRTISEVAEALDVPPHVLRFWETRFTQVKPVKRGGGRRYYRPEDVRLLRGIRGLLYDEGMTIKGVQKILRDRGIRHVIGLGTPFAEDMADDADLSETPVPASFASGDHRGETMRMDEDFEPSDLVESLTEVTLKPAKGQFDTAAIAELLARLEELRLVMLREPES